MIDVKYIHTHTYTYGYRYMYTSKHRGIFHIHNTFNGYSFIFFSILFLMTIVSFFPSFSYLFTTPLFPPSFLPSFLLLPFFKTPFLFLYMYIIRFPYIFNINSFPLIYCAVFTIFSPLHYFYFYFIFSFIHSFLFTFSHSLSHTFYYFS